MSPKRVKNPAISIPDIAIGELYHESHGAIESESPMMSIHEIVLSVSTLELILSIIFSSSLYLESSRTVMV